MGARVPALAIRRRRQRALRLGPKALAAAGLRPHRRPWTREAIVAALRTWAHAHGRAPYEPEWQQSRLEHPSAGTVKRAFGSWSDAVRAAGMAPALHAPWTQTEVLDGLRAFERDHGRPPTCALWRREHRKPGASVIIRRHGSWSAALTAALGPDA